MENKDADSKALEEGQKEVKTTVPIENQDPDQCDCNPEDQTTRLDGSSKDDGAVGETEGNQEATTCDCPEADDQLNQDLDPDLSKKATRQAARDEVTKLVEKELNEAKGDKVRLAELVKSLERATSLLCKEKTTLHVSMGLHDSGAYFRASFNNSLRDYSYKLHVSTLGMTRLCKITKRVIKAVATLLGLEDDSD